MRRIYEVAIVAAAIAFAVLGIDVQNANAELRSSAASPDAPSNVKTKGRPHIAREHQTRPKSAAAQPETAPAGAAPVFLSDAWLRQEKQTDDRLKRFMNICKGC